MMKKCPSCRSELESGSLIDFTNGAGIIQRYAKVANFPTGIKRIIGTYEVSFKEMRRVHALRCSNCNQIFLFAQDEILSADLKNDFNKLLLKMVLLVFIIFIIIVVVVLR